MLLGGSSGDSCTKRSDGHSSGTSSPHSDPNQSFNSQSKNGQHAFPAYPPGLFLFIFHFIEHELDCLIDCFILHF